MKPEKCSQAFLQKGKNCSQATFATADLLEVANTSRSFRLQYHVLAYGLQLVPTIDFYSVCSRKGENVNDLNRNTVVFSAQINRNRERQ